MDNLRRRLRENGKEIPFLLIIVILSAISDPHHASRTQSLAMAHLLRYQLSRQQDDLDKAILHLTEVIYLPTHSDTRPLLPNIVQILYVLTQALFLRADASRQPEDIKRCITLLRYLHAQQLEVPKTFPFSVTMTLFLTLAAQVELKLGHVDQNIEEMADLCGELLNSDIAITSLTDRVVAFSRAAAGHVEGLPKGQIPSEKVISCLRKASIRLPDLRVASIVLAESLLKRFEITTSDDDYNEGIAILDKVITSESANLGDGRSRDLEFALHFATGFAMIQYLARGSPEPLEKAIQRIRTFIDRAHLEDSDRAVYTRRLSFLQGLRSMTGDDHYELSLTSELGKLPSFQNLTASLAEFDTSNSMPTAKFNQHVNALNPRNIARITDVTDINDAVKYCRELLASHPDSGLARFARKALPDLFYRAFECTDEIKYLNEAISATRDNINIADVSIQSVSLANLTRYLSTRVAMLNLREDIIELIEVFPKAANHQQLGFFRLPILYNWAEFAYALGHSSASTAYDRAMSSMQDSLIFAPTLDIQHSRIVSMRCFSTLPLDYASYQIGHGQLESAIETLERGRALLWSEMRGLRTSIDQIRLTDTHLADKFTEVNKDLEALTLEFSPNSNSDGGHSDIDGIDPYGHLVKRRQKLSNDRERLISQIRSLPGFSTFMKTPSFDTIYSAARYGPVIIINHSRWRSDILILLHNSPPSLISTSSDFYARAKNLNDQLLEARKKGLDSRIYEDTLRSVLKELYELVGQPVIKRFNELNVPEQSRVWWCPTSVFCSLPLHAMGPIPSDASPSRYFLDLYIPSYTPSLSALIESHKPSSRAIGKPSLLLVAHVDEKMPHALKEIKVVRDVDTRVTTLFSSKATPSAVLTRLHEDPFVHFVCHGTLESGKPFETSFQLHKGKRLLLLDIVRSQVPNAEFAFLCACHTAELTEESIADEVLHLSAAMQFCGFRSVVGTMWAMADMDGPDLARFFYESVFSDEWQGVHYYERTAKALRDAVVKLRTKKAAYITLERWVNFVHYGA